MSQNTVTTEQVHELIEQLAAMTAAASITPEIVANIFEKMRNLNDQEKDKIIAITQAYLQELNQAGIVGFISKETTQSEEDEVVFETDDGTVVGTVGHEGADFTNLKRGGQQVARMSDLPTKDSSIGENPSTTNVPTTKAVKDYVDANSGGDYPIETESTLSGTMEQVWGNDAETLEYAKIGSYGMKSKAYLDMQGNSVIPTKDTSIGETPSQTNVPTSKAVADYVEAHGGGGTGDLPIRKEDAQFYTEEQTWENNAGTQEYVKIGSYGVKAKNFLDLNGNPIVNRSSISVLPEAFLPERIFVVANDLVRGDEGNLAWRNRSYGAALFIDRLYNLATLPKIYFEQTGRDRYYFYAEIGSLASSKNMTETNKSLKIIGEDGFLTVNVKQAQASASNGSTDTVRLMCIGDSVTNGTGANFQSSVDGIKDTYWHILDRMFAMDRVDANDQTLFPFMTIGTSSQSSETLSYKNKSITLNSWAEGRGGWTALNYAFDEYGINTSTGENTKLNPFYDSSKSGRCKFSLAKYLETYRTIGDDGSPQSGTSPIGGRVATPTHIILQIGTNDTINNAGQLADFKAAIKGIIDNIRDEGFTDIEIGIALTGALPRTKFPELYPHIIGASSVGTTNAWFEKAKALIDFDAYDDKVTFIPTYFVQPTAEALGVKYIGDVISHKSEMAISGGHVPDLHPNCHAHASFAIQHYGWIKWTLGKNLINNQ